MKLVHSLDPSASVLVSPTHSWTVLPKDPNRLADAAKLQSHIDEVLRIHTNTLQASTDTFQENVREHKTGDGAAREDADAQRALKARDKHNTERLARHATSSSTVLRRDAEVRDQTLVAISYVRDVAARGMSRAYLSRARGLFRPSKKVMRGHAPGNTVRP